MAANYGSIDSVDSKETVQNLVLRITNNFQQIRQITKELNDLYQIMGGPHDSPARRNKLLQLQTRAKDLLFLTKSLFDSISHLKIADESSRLTITKVKEEYNMIIPKYNEIHEKIIAKMTQMALEARQSLSLVEPIKDDEFSDMNSQMTRDQEEINAAEEMMNRMKQLENNLVVAEQLFTEINKIVVECREDVEQIESNVESAYSDVDNGNQKLQEATTYKQKALKKKICIIITIIVILGIIGLIIGLTVKNNK